ncbi:hypothetical protein FHETE_309 [Fusarium heterosporum]|uniref:Uncharacterized protein n=1 Tax=Fusarium heterosporum TaxID=42747 RepID=A0A8H5U1C7_FUSHE|nr:hypothetical protein FHETE_309 [Fusarium heterosporum]
MGLIGLAIRSLVGDSDQQPRSGGCCGRRMQTQQLYLGQQQPQFIATSPIYTNYTGRPSCHQRKMERRYQRNIQRAERSQLRAEQRAERDFRKAERRQAGVMLVKSGAQRVGLIGGQAKNENARETRGSHEVPRVYEMDAINERHLQNDAPPAYDEVVRK